MRISATVRRLAVWTVALVSVATAYADSPRPSVKPPTAASRAKSHRQRASRAQRKTSMKGHKRHSGKTTHAVPSAKGPAAPHRSQ